MTFSLLIRGNSRELDAMRESCLLYGLRVVVIPYNAEAMPNLVQVCRTIISHHEDPAWRAPRLADVVQQARVALDFALDEEEEEITE